MVDASRLRDELNKMKKLIAENDEVRSRFDLDGDGHIDGFEWDQVRQLVIQRLEREEEELAEAAALGAESGAAPVHEPAPGVADQIYQNELHSPGASATNLSDAEDLVLTQKGGLGQIFEGTAKREYSIHSHSGAELGTISQTVSDLVAGLGRRGLESTVIDYTVRQGFDPVAVFRCTDGLVGSRLDILDPSGGQLGHVSWKPGLLRSSFRVVSTLDRGAMEVKAPFFKPWTLVIKSDLGEEIGEIVRGWSGLGGFLTGGNRMRVRLDKGRSSTNQRFALLAAALLADLQAEERKKRD